MKKNKKIIISITGIVLIALILVGLTYAYFLTQVTGNSNNKSVSVTTADIKLTYNDGNGIIELNKVKPNVTDTPYVTKTFSVYNGGNVSVEYGVFLENVTNTFITKNDLPLVIECSTSQVGNTCDGYDDIMLSSNDMLLTNEIEAGETQTYTLTLDYVDSGSDQSTDMGKTASGKIQIYGLNDTVDLSGTISDANSGDYIVVESTPKRSEIVNGKYKVVGLEPGSHTIKVYDNADTLRYSKEITISKGSSESISGTTITVLNDTRNVYVTLSSTNVTPSLIPYEEGTLAYAIINNAKTIANGTTYRKTPLTKPAEEFSGIYEKGTDPTTFTTTQSGATNYYVLYADDYTVDPKTGYYSLVSPVIPKYQQTYTIDDASKIVGKYAVITQFTPQLSYTQNSPSIYKISTDISDLTDTTIKYALLNNKSLVTTSLENTLSITPDDYGTSYYYRGSVTDNYVDFANMCWKIVRIGGDGSVKLILEDKDIVTNDSPCKVSDGNWNIPTTTGGSTLRGHYGYEEGTYGKNVITARYLNPSKNADIAQITAFKNFQTGTLTTNISSAYNNATLNDYLKSGDWCYADKAYTTVTGETEITDKTVYYTAKTRFYYDSYVRLSGASGTYNPTLKCNGTVFDKFGDNTTNMYVGTLTADETIYAGAKYNIMNNNYYLINDYLLTNSSTLGGFATMSPSYFYSSSKTDTLFYTYGDNTFKDQDVFWYASFRPSIQLKSGITISGGVGTKTNPYVIN